MEQRGRKSLARLSVVRPDGISSLPRVQPPPDMPEEEAQLWVSVVESKPADWFDAATVGMLADFCRHTVESRHLSAMITRLRQSGEFDLQQYKELLRMREVESRAASSLGTRMRLTQQSTYSARKSSTVVTTPKPWESQ